MKLSRRVCDGFNYALRYLQDCEILKPVKFDFKASLNLMIESCLQLSLEISLVNRRYFNVVQVI